MTSAGFPTRYLEIHIGDIGGFAGRCFGGELPKSRLGLSVNEVKVEPQFGGFS
jgi:hypothetical protein